MHTFRILPHPPLCGVTSRLRHDEPLWDAVTVGWRPSVRTQEEKKPGKSFPPPDDGNDRARLVRRKTIAELALVISRQLLLCAQVVQYRPTTAAPTDVAMPQVAVPPIVHEYGATDEPPV